MRENNFVLGLDLGVASIGWALTDFEEQRIVAAGVRIFDSSMDVAKFQAGEPGGSNAIQRRKSIHQGRQIARRRARHRDLYIALQNAKVPQNGELWPLLPFAGRRAERRHEVLTVLDKELADKWRPLIRQNAPKIADPGQVVCYWLRAIALTEKLEPNELGRALYHLGQRRGFKSNRRESRASLNGADAAKEQQERSKIKQTIGSLQQELNASGQTLAQHLALVNPHTAALRNRKRSDIAPIWTGRSMYQDEFERIWASQSAYYPSVLTDDLKRRIERLMFWQRKVSAGKPGNCELERDRVRAPRSSLLAQHFRVVQTVNNLRIRESSTQPPRKLRDSERQRLIAALDTAITPIKCRKGNSELYGLRFAEVKKQYFNKGTKLNLEDGDAESYLRGNRSNAIMARAFGIDRWMGMADGEKRRIVRRWIREQDPQKLLEVAKARWGLCEESATQLASIEPEDGYAALSHRAMRKLLPSMEDGLSYSEAVAKEYGFTHGIEREFLSPVTEVLPQIPNPVVERTLSELRKVINALIREFRRPKQIRIELARDLKRNAEQRAGLQDDQKSRAAERAAAKKTLEAIGIRPSGESIEKILLYRRWGKHKPICPYCAGTAHEYLGSPEEIFAEGSGIQVEHVLPRRIVDNSPSNKVLAHHSCNMKKGDRTPFQAFGDTPEWANMVRSVESLNDQALLDKFTMSTEEQLKDFSARHLSDTRYISKLAAQYLEHLYGGRDAAVPWEDRNRRCVFASSGVVTGELRKRWGLNGILKNPYGKMADGKVRTDHRHHAIDAIVIALTTEAVIQQASRDSQNHDRVSGYSEPRYFTPPWPRFGDTEERVNLFRREIFEVVKGIKVSSRVNHRLNGSLHEDFYYSPKTEEHSVYRRVNVCELTMKQIEDEKNKIDAEILKALRVHFARLGLTDREAKLKVFEDNVPYLEKNGNKVFIRKVRKAYPASSVEILDRRQGQPSVKTGENHHFVVFERMNDNGEPEWYSPGPVTRRDAMRRKDAAKRAGIKPYPIIETNDGPGSRYVMHLMKGDAVVMRDNEDRVELYILASASEGDYVFLRHSAVVPSPRSVGLTLSEVRKQMQDRGDRVRITNPSVLRQRDCRKVSLDPLGRWTYCESRKAAHV